jgi:tRNA 2-thiouridine synthesizing protein E
MYQSNFWLTYETTTMPKEEHKTTEQNFLHNFNDWNERFAHNIIREWKLKQGLTDRHREIIAFLRKYYQITANIPTVNETCRKFDLDLAEFRELFPEGYRRGACRIAGLPFFP